MTKKNLTLGLLVFIVGVMITACGDKNNGGGATADANEVPQSWDERSCEDCTRTYNGRFRIVDEDLYLQAFGHVSGNDIGFGGNDVFNSVLGQILEPAAGVLVCGTQAFLTEAVANLFGIEDVDIECTTEDLDVFGTVNDYEDIRSEYNARIRVRYEDGRADAIEMTIDSNIDGGDDQEIFYYERSNRFVNREDTLLLQNANGRVRLGTTGGRLIGEFRN